MKTEFSLIGKESTNLLCGAASAMRPLTLRALMLSIRRVPLGQECC